MSLKQAMKMQKILAKEENENKLSTDA